MKKSVTKRLGPVLLAAYCLLIPDTVWARNIGFASPDIHRDMIKKSGKGNVRDWILEIENLSEEIYTSMYTAVYEIVTTKNITDFKPKVLEDMNNIQLMPENRIEVHEFHLSVSRLFDKYLRRLGMKNNAGIIVYALFKKLDIKRFVSRKGDNLMLKIMVFYMDSNTLGVEYVPIKRANFSDYTSLMAKINKGVLDALDKALINIDTGPDPQPAASSFSAGGSGNQRTQLPNSSAVNGEFPGGTQTWRPLELPEDIDSTGFFDD